MAATLVLITTPPAMPGPVPSNGFICPWTVPVTYSPFRLMLLLLVVVVVVAWLGPS